MNIFNFRCEQQNNRCTSLVAAVLILLCYASPLLGQKVYWADAVRHKIQRSNLDGTNLEDIIVKKSGFNPIAIALDLENNHIYSTIGGLPAKIIRSNLDGSDFRDLIVSDLDFPRSIALDLTNQKMYWPDLFPDRILRSNLDGSDIEDVVTDRLEGGSGVDMGDALDIALDLSDNNIYWTDFDGHRIQRADIDSGWIVNILTSGFSNPKSIVLDIEKNLMYFSADFFPGRIYCATLFGTDLHVIATTAYAPTGLMIDHNIQKLYWLDEDTKNGTAEFWRADLDGNNQEFMFKMDIESSILSLALDTRVLNDVDQDDIPDEVDNCIDIPNSDQSDIDSDGHGDLCDKCVDSNADQFIVIRGCQTGVDNRMLTKDCTMADLLNQCIDTNRNHGQFVSCIAHKTKVWMRDQVINNVERTRILRCAAKSKTRIKPFQQPKNYLHRNKPIQNKIAP